MFLDLLSDPLFYWAAIFFLLSLLIALRLIRKILLPSSSTISPASEKLEISTLERNFKEMGASLEALEQIFRKFSKSFCETIEQEITILQKRLEEETRKAESQTNQQQDQLASSLARLTGLQKQMLEEQKQALTSFELFLKKMQEEELQLSKEIDSSSRLSRESVELLKKRVVELTDSAVAQIQVLDQKFQKDFTLNLENQKALALKKEKLASQLAGLRQLSAQNLKSIEFEIEKTKNQIQTLELNRKEKMLEREKLRQEETVRWTARLSLLRQQREKEQAEYEKATAELKREEAEIQEKSNQQMKQAAEEYQKRLSEIGMLSTQLEKEIQELKATLDREQSQNLKKEKELSFELARLSSEMKKLQDEKEMEEKTAESVYALELRKLQEEMVSLEIDLEENRKIRAETLHKKELELKEWKEHWRSLEEQSRSQFHLQEKKGTEEKFRLEEEKIKVQEGLSQLRAVARKQTEAITLELEKVRQDLLQKENELEKQLLEKNRQMEKTKEKLLKKMAVLKDDFLNEQKESEKEIKKKESLVQTLKLKLSWRKDRIEAEISRRNERLEKWMKKMKKDIEMLQEQKAVERSTADAEIKKLTEILLDLEKLREAKAVTIQKDASEKEAIHLIGSRLEVEIQSLQQEWKCALENFSQRIALKEKEIQLLGSEIEVSEIRLETETKRTQEIFSQARKMISGFPAKENSANIESHTH